MSRIWLNEEEIRAELARRDRSTPGFEYGLYDDGGRLCTKVICVVAIRPKGYLEQVGFERVAGPLQE